MPLFELPSTRRRRRQRAILRALRCTPGGMTAPELARQARVTVSHARILLGGMQRKGWIGSWTTQSWDEAGPGTRRYAMARAGWTART